MPIRSSRASLVYTMLYLRYIDRMIEVGHCVDVYSIVVVDIVVGIVYTIFFINT